MEPILSAPCTPAQRQRDVLLGALVGLARSTVNEPKTEDTDHVLAAGLRQAANADAAEEALARMTRIVETEKHRVAPNCATCTMRCAGQTRSGQLRFGPVVGGPGNHPRPQAADAALCVPAGAGPPGCRRPGSDRPGPVCAGRGLGRNPAPARGPAGGGTLRPMNFPVTAPVFCCRDPPGRYCFFARFSPYFQP